MNGTATDGRHGRQRIAANAGADAAVHEHGDAIDRGHLLDRLQSLREILPMFAQEAAAARRQAAVLRVENRRLLGRIQQLQREHSGPPQIIRGARAASAMDQEQGPQ